MTGMERELHFTHTYGPDDQGRYLKLPFDVPVNTDRVEVEYAYGRFVTEELPEGRRRREAAIVDLGLYDETGRMRGWSGSERTSVAVSASSATPGYRAGPVGAGRWAVSLGLYKIQGRSRSAVTIRLPEKRETCSRATCTCTPSTATAPSARPRWSSCAGARGWTSWPSRTTTTPGRTTRSAERTG